MQITKTKSEISDKYLFLLLLKCFTYTDKVFNIDHRFTPFFDHFKLLLNKLNVAHTIFSLFYLLAKFSQDRNVINKIQKVSFIFTLTTALNELTEKTLKIL